MKNKIKKFHNSLQQWITSKKRGVFFSIDALIAIGIIFLVILIAFPIVTELRPKTELHYDILSTLSTLKIGEIQGNSYVNSLISGGQITNLDKTILEQIGEFYVIDVDLAKSLADSVLSDIDTNQNIGLWYENTLIWSSNSTAYSSTIENIDTARQIISGLGGVGNTSITGFSARAFLATGLQQEYFYFGGYVGDGNLSANISYIGEIVSAEMELAINNDFNLLINGVPSVNNPYQSSPDEFTPANYSLPITDFISGSNLLEFEGNNLHIAGGFIKITYESNVTFQQPTRYNFPGIEGLINLYDGFYVPGDLTGLDIFLHMNSTKLKTFLNIGNITVFNGTTNDEEIITVDTSSLNFATLSRETIPLRLGLENVTFALNVSLDLISVADLSKAMACSVSGGNCGNGPGQCTACGGTWLLPLDDSKSAHTLLINEILSLSSSRLGISGYHVSVPAVADEPLTNNAAQLQSTVDAWDSNTLSSQNRRLCLGIQDAVNEFETSSDDDTIKVAIVMSAGIATHDCSGVISGDLNLNGIPDDPGDDAIKVVCDAHSTSGIIFHAVSYGNTDDATMQKIAECGNGTWYSSDISGLADLYEEIVNNIISQYSEQAIEIVGGELYTKLYPDSYIEFTYAPEPTPLGLIVTKEKKFDNGTSGTFSIPQDATVLKTTVASYSGPRWTTNVEINGNLIYNLTSYGNNYIVLGDPYSFNIPNSIVNADNTVTLTTAISPASSSPGSSSNKIIYTIAKNASTFSQIKSTADGCIWQIQFEERTDITVNVPGSYIGVEKCFYNETSWNADDNDYGLIENSNDVFQLAVLALLRDLDLDSNGKVDFLFTEQDLQIDLTALIGIPFTWSTEVQIRIWN